MAVKFISERNLKFLLYEVFDLEAHTGYDYYSEHTRKGFDLVLKAATKLAKDLLFPIFEEMDRAQPELIDGELRVQHFEVVAQRDGLLGFIVVVTDFVGWGSLGRCK